jgi:hypothetical protein
MKPDMNYHLLKKLMTHSKVECFMGSQLLTPVDKLRLRVQVVAISATNCPNSLNLPIQCFSRFD